jgi:hypothetical protein
LIDNQKRHKYSILSVAKKLQLMDQLHDNAAALRAFRPKTKA